MQSINLIFVVLVFLFSCFSRQNSGAFAFVVVPHQRYLRQWHSVCYSSTSSPDKGAENENADDDDDEEEEVEPGTMRVSEIKAELKMRGVKFDDCFDKESLVLRLQDARSSGKADPSILSQFNKQKLEENVSGKKVEISDEAINSAVANDGTLPGGLDPESLKELMGNPEIMTLLQSTKMQEAMKIMMTGGHDELKEALKEDVEMRSVIAKLNDVMGSSLQS